ncbi:phosphoenolpyruvate synthase [candidate division WWE3 bacterium RIFCSPHIGHO2_01_FULL_40_23]|uniref:Phosphoenolpyruvate synthase n=1 Tax=candidate division WWE3 bacterium RIFCSPLOWO2_01_FULL_41_18 TaxID=1802625 RepID=A0A1F4VCI2_UNCKA|nr:MAG: phosphoenolpyruvate synthase [candidate division WWE3 bacterium RIFCSPHIGHO2_01_FULL_40_23]OGC54946.1 MAG: phosphoenolpyruvate synthase [candidate division WWE3 bacterium RIFCSPLOWO2_01_FULL_41_18]
MVAHVLWFSEIGKNDIKTAGGKGANLGEMYTAGIPVPNGFVVTSDAYFDFIEVTSIKNKILTELSGLDLNDSKKLLEASNKIKTAILSASLAESLREEIKNAYHKLCGEMDKLVAVRSSATAEDLPDASFAGQQETYLNVIGYEDVVHSVQKCYASLFESRAIFYRTDKGFSHLKVGIAVPVQLMVQSEVSGIMFTVNPLTNEGSEISIEAGFGLGQPIVSGEVIPDQYVVEKEGFKIKAKELSKQTWQLTKEGKVQISKAYRETQKLTDDKVVELAVIGKKIEDHYGYPCDIEWGLENSKLYIVQSRPVTTLKMKVEGEHEKISVADEKLLLSGLAASPGVVFGKVRIIKGPKEIGRVKEGDVLVATMTNPDYVPAMRRAVAIVTDEGGRTSHAAIVSRELGIPAVVGTVNATKILKDGEVITVDGGFGKVFEGDVSKSHKVKEEKVDTSNMKTATKLYVNLAEPDIAGEISKRNVDGVGLLRAEFMIAQIGEHPRLFIKEGRQKEFIRRLSEGLLSFAKAFNPRPVIYRATDFRTNEYKNLKGGEEFEGFEPNPMLGFRGAYRYISDNEVFNLELEAMKEVRNKQGFKNLHLMIPFVRTVPELREVKKFVSASGLRRGGNFKFWMMCEIPSNVILLESFIEEGIDGVSIGSNDLTMLILGVDRDNEKVSKEFNEQDPAVLWALERVITLCSKNKVTCSICGQAPSEYPELVEKLVSWGVTSVSVSPDVIDKTRKIIYDAERKLLNKKK